MRRDREKERAQDRNEHVTNEEATDQSNLLVLVVNRRHSVKRTQGAAVGLSSRCVDEVTSNPAAARSGGQSSCRGGAASQSDKRERRVRRAPGVCLPSVYRDANRDGEQ